MLPKLRLGATLRSYQIWVFIITFMLYAAVHSVRKTLATVTNPMIDLGYTKVFISYMNAAFMLSYAIGMVFTGTLGDRYKPTGVLLVSCTISALLTGIIGLMAPQLNISGLQYLYVAFWLLNGLAQSCVWPTEVKLMSNWFGQGHSGSIYGLWSANGSVGNIIGIGFTALCFSIWNKDETGVTWAFEIPCIFLLIFTVITFLLPDTRSEAGFPEEESVDPNKATIVVEESHASEKLSFWAAWWLPGVLRYSFCYACIKSINYTLFYWLTPFLQDAGHDDSIVFTITSLNDVGWIFGGLVCGFGSDLMGSRAPFVGLFILLAIIPTVLIYPCVSSVGVTAALITLNGFFAGGAGNVVASAVCADIGKLEKVKGSPDVTGQVTGIVDGIGALGAAATQVVVGYTPKGSWSLIFNALSGMLLVAFLLISDLVYRETLDWWRGRARNSKIPIEIVEKPELAL